MLKKYIKPKLEVIEIESEDVMVSSDKPHHGINCPCSHCSPKTEIPKYRTNFNYE